MNEYIKYVYINETEDDEPKRPVFLGVERLVSDKEKQKKKKSKKKLTKDEIFKLLS